MTTPHVFAIAAEQEGGKGRTSKQHDFHLVNDGHFE